MAALPSKSTATHSAEEGHETLISPECPTFTGGLQDGSAFAGSVEMTTLPWVSTAAQRAPDGHEMLLRPPALSIRCGAFQVGAAAVGSVEIVA